MFACPISDLLERFGGVEVFIFSDVTYGACCIDDFAARALNCDLLVHYGHSCLVPVDITTASPSELPLATQIMYVFVDVHFDTSHMIESIKLEFPGQSSRIALLGTIQFSGALHQAKLELDKYYSFEVQVPQAKPLSAGEVLGCTSPVLTDVEALIFVADGRFHMESAMIANPNIPTLRYDPYSKAFTREGYDFKLLNRTRRSEIERAKQAKNWGIILGTLGRQGNPKILSRITEAINQKFPAANIFVLLLSEISPAKLRSLEEKVDAWVQIACPRLSIDWGKEISSKPLLTSFEFFVAVGLAEWKTDYYPQDYYSRDGGVWSNHYIV